MKAAYLGPDGSYSSIAVRAMAPEAEPIAYSDFECVFDAAETGACDCAVVPVENSIEGNVNAILDLLAKTSLRIVKEYDLAIDNRIFTLPDSGPITRIASHPQAYNQCRATLRKRFPAAVFVPTASTAAALDALDLNTAAVAGSANNREGLAMSDPVSDRSDNLTRFFLLSAQSVPVRKSGKISMIFEAENRPGGLLRILSVLDRYRLNMTAIQSRPCKAEFGRYLFYVDAEGNLNDERTQKAILEIERTAPFFRLLGYYEAADRIT